MNSFAKIPAPSKEAVNSANNSVYADIVKKAQPLVDDF